MSVHRSARTLRKATTGGLTPATLSLVPRDDALHAHVDDVDDDALLNFHESDVIADIVPIPSSIPSSIRDALERMMLLRYRGDTEALHRWLHADDASLRGASPFEALCAGDGHGVLRALGGSRAQTFDHRAAGPVRRRFGHQLRIVR
jgi:hypothetical protein